MKNGIVFCLLFLGVVAGLPLALFLTEPVFLLVSLGCFIGLILFLYHLDPKGMERDIARRTKAQQDYDNEYGVTSYFPSGKDRKKD